ncbi:MAG: cytochrome b N-terminal domain-containing protein [Gemmatimonadota bacterium]
MGIAKRTGSWLVDRVGLDRIYAVLAKHKVPAGATDRKKGWMYVFGAATLVAFLLQVVTGIVLATYYVPAPAEAYDSLIFINERVRFGAVIRGLHFFGASAMVVLVTVHMLQVFLSAAYKFPREVNWLSGVALLLLTMAMAFTGQLLRWDANGVWGVFVASHYAGRVPGIGEALKEFILSGQTVGGATLSRFFGLHVILMPLMIFGIVGLHLYLVFRNGISEPPEPGRKVEPSSYRSWYRSLLERSGRPYFPDAVWREAVAGAVVVGAVVVLAITLGPRGPGAPPDPTFIPAEPKPDWFLLWYYGLIAIKPPELETFVMVYLPLIGIAMLLLLPLLFGKGERSPSRRPWAVVGAVLIVTLFAVLTELGARSPWVMDFETEPLGAAEIGPASAQVIDGAQLFHERGCQYCHTVAGRGGQYGPSLDRVMGRLPPSIVTTRIVQGYGNMPGYRATLTREELSTILIFLHHLEER